METPMEKYIKFQEKVKRTVYIDNLSPKVTEAVLRTALGQFGTVISVQFVPNYIESKNIPQCALVEMENAKQAKSIVAEMESYPFMMSGMPRPVRAFAADPGMFVDRPPKPDRKIQCKWMDPKDQDFAVAKEIKKLTNKHRAEASYLLTLQLEEEEKLHKQQADSLKANYRKFEMIDKVQSDGTLGRLGKRMKLKITDD